MEPNSDQLPRQISIPALDEAARALVTTWCRAHGKIAGNVPPSQLQALYAIEAQADISMGELAARLGATSSATSRLCDRMIASGLLLRTGHPDDGRLVVLTPTAEGRQLLNELRRQRHRDLEAVLRRMPHEVRAQLLAALSAFAEHATAGEPPAAAQLAAAAEPAVVAEPAGGSRPVADAGPAALCQDGTG
ncbi:MarR family winged helix-turn-helix transcriptional regulator [Actinomadura opuntiae]|uniref:MarR family winged helix-turn-helix transcriptional regulator n=1 Tax=Actinomadura sp. OS1-43 TaxID=604315 RepID=UPI00255B1271|nr:MarR family transcriptional regulator [Actinomadura sp. OS1-43]MDL4814436.1 MarR family transcriptional regulator [Actinomadura sp. OS1-43]